MKALSIGRDQECDITINDATDVISKRHATLNISPSGKITIVDLSRNGTYVNGIRISPNVPVPVSRKDIISFAHVNKLDWNAVPIYNSMIRYIIMGGVGILIVICGIFAYQYMPDNPSTPDPKQETVSIADSLKKEKPGVVKDSINIKKEDSKQKEDSTFTKPQKQKEKKGENKKEPTPSAPKDSTWNNRPIG